MQMMQNSIQKSSSVLIYLSDLPKKVYEKAGKTTKQGNVGTVLASISSDPVEMNAFDSCKAAL